MLIHCDVTVKNRIKLKITMNYIIQYLFCKQLKMNNFKCNTNFVSSCIMMMIRCLFKPTKIPKTKHSSSNKTMEPFAHNILNHSN